MSAKEVLIGFDFKIFRLCVQSIPKHHLSTLTGYVEICLSHNVRVPFARIHMEGTGLSVEFVDGVQFGHEFNHVKVNKLKDDIIKAYRMLG